MLEFVRYTNVDEFMSDVLDILLEDEVCNNIPVSILVDSNLDNVSGWLMATVTDDSGNILLIALCASPFRLLLSEPAGTPYNSSVEFFAKKLRNTGFTPSGIIAKSSLARRFADAYCGGASGGGSGASGGSGFGGADGGGGFGGADADGFSISSRHHMTMILMRLDKLTEVCGGELRSPAYQKPSGFFRVLNENDLAFTPAWENAFCVDCRAPVYSLTESEKRIRTRLGMNIHFIWEDRQPVSQAVIGRNTPKGAAISWVYTPPEFRGRGYATSVVAALSKVLLDGGKSFCYLFADAENPASCAIYRKLGYYDVCEFDDIKFDIER